MGKRKVYAPYSTSGENVGQTPLEGYIEVQQEIIPTIETGFVDENGLWVGNLSSDTAFIIYKDEAIADGGTILTPSVDADGTWPLDMTGFSDLFLAIRPSNGGNYAITAVMGPDSNSFANLSPVNAATTLVGNSIPNLQDLENLFHEGAEVLTVDVWNIFILTNTLANQKLLQFKIVNNSGGISTIDTAFMRLV